MCTLQSRLLAHPSLFTFQDLSPFLSILSIFFPLPLVFLSVFLVVDLCFIFPLFSRFFVFVTLSDCFASGSFLAAVEVYGFYDTCVYPL